MRQVREDIAEVRREVEEGLSITRTADQIEGLLAQKRAAESEPAVAFTEHVATTTMLDILHKGQEYGAISRKGVSVHISGELLRIKFRVRGSGLRSADGPELFSTNFFDALLGSPAKVRREAVEISCEDLTGARQWDPYILSPETPADGTVASAVSELGIELERRGRGALNSERVLNDFLATISVPLDVRHRRRRGPHWIAGVREIPDASSDPRWAITDEGLLSLTFGFLIPGSMFAHASVERTMAKMMPLVFGHLVPDRYSEDAVESLAMMSTVCWHPEASSNRELGPAAAWDNWTEDVKETMTRYGWNVEFLLGAGKALRAGFAGVKIAAEPEGGFARESELANRFLFAVGLAYAAHHGAAVDRSDFAVRGRVHREALEGFVSFEQAKFDLRAAVLGPSGGLLRMRTGTPR